MDIYELSTSEQIDIDDLLDLSNDELFPSTNNDQSPSSETPFNDASTSAADSSAVTTTFSIDFTRDLCLPSDDDVAELEWLSQFVEDSFTDIPSYSLNSKNDHSSFLSKTCSKSSRAAPTIVSKTKREIMQRGAYLSALVVGRRCSHCASEKTPQWRTGPLGPKTLCNACGVRYKSGRLVPEYRPAASPTFVPTRHSNSHRKVMELRRKKEEDEEQVCRQRHHHHHRQQRKFKVC